MADGAPLNLVDSSGWIEYLAGGPSANLFAAAIESEPGPVVSALSLTEVYEHVIRHYGRPAALKVGAAMRRGRIVEVSSGIALHAAELSVEHDLPSAHGIILATARSLDAQLWTQDERFRGLDRVALVAAR